MPRMYTVIFESVAISAAQDLFQIKGAAGKQVEIARIKIGATDTTQPTSQQMSWRARFLPATVTDGGGSSVTPQPIDHGDAAASFTAIANSTSKASTSGTASILYEGGDHIFNGLDETWDGILVARPQVGPSESIVVELLSTVSGTVHLSGTIWCVERGG